MVRIVTAHTADLSPATLAGIRALLVAAFDGDFGDDDWEHGLGGIHALVHEEITGGGEELVAHGSVIMRRVRHTGRFLRVGYVEALAVRADRRRAGHGGRIMAELERVIEGAYELGALSASDEGALLYAARGWQVWPGRIEALGPEGVVRLPDEEGTTYVWPRLPQPTGGSLLFDWRDGDVL